MADQKNITLREGAGSSKDITLRELPVADFPFTPIYLYAGEDSPKDVRLRDPSLLVSTGVLASLNIEIGSIALSSDVTHSGGGAALGADLTASIGALTLSSETDVVVGASLALSIGALTLSGDADVVVGAGLASSIGNVSLSADVDVHVQAALSASLGDVTLASDATLQSSVGATLSASIGEITLTCDADVRLGAALSASIGDITISSEGVVVVRAGVLRKRLAERAAQERLLAEVLRQRYEREKAAAKQSREAPPLLTRTYGQTGAERRAANAADLALQRDDDDDDEAAAILLLLAG